MKLLLKVAVFSLVFTGLTAKKGKKEETEETVETSDSDESLEYEKYVKVFDLRGELRQRFGLIAALKEPDQSSVCSPISALLPLGKLALGAEDAGLKELNRAIGVSVEGSSNTLKEQLSGLIKDLKRLPGVILDIANKLYVSDKQRFFRNYTKEAKKIFKSTIERVDFEQNERVSNSINKWVSLETHGMIRQLISPEDISPLSSLVIVNAVYFAGKWKYPFSTATPGSFHSPKGIRKVPMMSNFGWYEYEDSDVLSAQIVQIPYIGEEASFLIVLPKQTESLQNLLNRIKEEPKLLAKAIERMKTVKLNLSMPKFKIESELNLKVLYEKIRLNSIFSPSKSGLTGIVRKESLYVTTAIQKAVIDVTEQGTEASAASAILSLGSAPGLVAEFTADRPFLFYVMAKSQQLFVGIYV